MAQGCAETGEMQAVAKQGDIVSNGKGEIGTPAFWSFCSKRTIKYPSRMRGVGGAEV